ncbi:MAG TPA: invertase [Lachnospiraceae bacterium]|nr:invertase [Lachnospiraceae bacterium]
MNYGYIRVSTDKQTVENQRFEILQFCQREGLKIDGWIEETVSGGKAPDKRKLGLLLKEVKEGDWIICSELSRLGRSLFMIMNILSLCMEKGVIVRSIKDNFTLGDDLQSKVLAFAFGLSAEIEKSLISSRTKAALEERKAQGVVLGRPKGSKNSNNKLLPHQDVIRTLVEQDNTYSEVARLFHVDRSTMKRFCDDCGIKRPFNRNKKSANFIVVNKEPISDNNNEQTVNNLLTIKI